MKEKAVHYMYQYIKEYLTPMKYFFMHNLSGNFYLFLDIIKSYPFSVFQKRKEPPSWRVSSPDISRS